MLNMQMYCDSLSDAITSALDKMVGAAGDEIASKGKSREDDDYHISERRSWGL